MSSSPLDTLCLSSSLFYLVSISASGFFSILTSATTGSSSSEGTITLGAGAFLVSLGFLI